MERTVSFPVLPEWDQIIGCLDKTSIDVITCALLYYCETKDDTSIHGILPPYLYNQYEKYLSVLNEHFKKNERRMQ